MAVLVGQDHLAAHQGAEFLLDIVDHPFAGGRFPDTGKELLARVGVIVLRGRRRVARADVGRLARFRRRGLLAETRSEEQTSELPSLLRISYAVFCLQKKKIN